MSLSPLVNIRVILPEGSSHRAARAVTSSTQRPSLLHALHMSESAGKGETGREVLGHSLTMKSFPSLPTANEVFLLTHQSLLLPSFNYPSTNRPGLRRPCVSIYMAN